MSDIKIPGSKKDIHMAGVMVSLAAFLADARLSMEEFWEKAAVDVVTMETDERIVRSLAHRRFMDFVIVQGKHYEQVLAACKKCGGSGR